MGKSITEDVSLRQASRRVTVMAVDPVIEKILDNNKKHRD